ncbi:MAG: hypothetical protein ACRBB0_09020 [Pelagimonas sp.]|uniref:hypothetical protein n=1 Tax=Pelagimonas sp. TaxID=2073170 RepID=UPI003D6BEEB3
MQSKKQTTMPQNSDQRWFQAYYRSSATADLEPCAELTDLPDLLRQAKNGAGGLVLYTPPARAVAECLADGLSAQAALEDWAVICTQVLGYQRQNRSRLFLMEGPQTDQTRQDAQAVLAEVLEGASLPTVVETGETGFTDLAALALGQNSQKRELVDTLQAASLGFYGELPEAFGLIEAVLADHQSLEETRSADAQNAEQATQKAEVLVQQVTALEAQATALEAQTTAELSKRVALEEAHRAALAQSQQELILVQSQSAAAQTAQKTAEQGHAVLMQQIADLEDEMRQLRQEADSLAKVAAERDVLRQQSAAQAAQGQAASNQKSEEQNLTDVLLKQVSSLEKALKLADKRREGALADKRTLDTRYREQVAELSGNLDEMYQSTSWRITEPLRKVVRRIRRDPA